MTLTQWRADTPATATICHLNNAGAGLMPAPVLQAITDHLALEARVGGYEAAEGRAEALERAYASLGRLLGADPRHLAVVENATVGFWQALDAFDLQPGDRILTTVNEYASYRITWLALARRIGVEVVTARELPEGGADPNDWRRQLAHPLTRFATICWSPTNSGILQDVPRLVALAREAGVPSHVDACQAVGQVAIDCAALGCDFLSGTGRKFLRGPRGIGFLYVSGEVLGAGRYPRHLDGRGATWTEAQEFTLDPTARRFENWEFPYALVLGLGAAADYALGVGMEKASGRARRLAAEARRRLAEIPGISVMDRERGSVPS